MRHVKMKQLLVFVTAMRFRSVARTARILGCAEASVRYNLCRLSEIADESLFLQGKHGELIPSHRAVHLEARANAMLDLWCAISAPTPSRGCAEKVPAETACVPGWTVDAAKADRQSHEQVL